MRRINPTLRGFLIIAAVSAAIVALRLEATLGVLFLIARIVFVIAIAFFLYVLWRERRAEIATWPGRAQAVFYGAAVLSVADIAAISFVRESGPDAAAFVVVLVLCGFSMWRTWRDQHTLV